MFNFRDCFSRSRPKPVTTKGRVMLTKRDKDGEIVCRIYDTGWVQHRNSEGKLVVSKWHFGVDDAIGLLASRVRELEDKQKPKVDCSIVAEDLAQLLLGEIKFGDSRDNPEWKEEAVKAGANIIRSEFEKLLERKLR